MQDNNFNNIQEFENNYELRKALNKLENELQNKDYELNLTKNLYQELRELKDKKEKECNDLGLKLNTVRSDMRNLEKKLQNEIDTMKMNFAKETEIYNNKILKLSEFNPSNLQKNIEYRIENKYKQELTLKDKEIEDLSNKLSQMEQQYELLIAEYEEYKINTQNEFDTQKHFHQTEVNSLLEKIRLNEDMNSSRNNSGDNTDNFLQIKAELDNTRRQVTELNNEIDKLRHDKELLIIERNEHKINLIKERDKQNFDKKNMELAMSRQIDNLNNALKERDFKINELLKEKQNLNEKLASQDMEFIDTKNDINKLKNILKSNEEENHKLFLEKEKIQKESIIKEKQEKESLQKQIDDLSMKLKDAKNSKIKKEYIYEGNNKGYKELINKLKKMTEKKNEYKIKCKMARENIDQIIKKLDENQEKEFEKILLNTKKKYSQYQIESDDEK